jgi:hypothetical protein
MKIGWTTGPNRLSEERWLDGSYVAPKPLPTYCICNYSHIVQFFRANVWTIREAKVYEAPFPNEVVLTERFALMRD